MGRPLERRVRVVLSSRTGQDPLALFHAIEDAFRPKDLEIKVVDSDDLTTELFADEQLETKVTELAKDHLDKKANSRQAKPVQECRREDEIAPAADVISVRIKIMRLVKRFSKDLGWKILVKVVADYLMDGWGAAAAILSGQVKIGQVELEVPDPPEEQELDQP